MPRITLHQGQWLSIVGTNLTTSFQGGTVNGLEGCDEVDIEILATFDVATTLTNLIFQLQVSDDNTNFEPVSVVQASTGSVVGSATIAAASGTTVRDRLQIAQAGAATFRNAKYHRIAVKTTGASKSGDAASSSLNVSFV